jgi:DNA-binding NarL/FixJ family response regulator
MGTIESPHTLSQVERTTTSILLVEPEAGDRNLLRATLRSLGFGTIAEAPNHHAALDKFEGRKFTHLIFDAKKGNYPIKEWFTQILEISPHIVAIPTSANPSVDDVFELLLAGARGYLVKPFARDDVDQSVVLATKGEPIPDVVKQARDRNEALVAIIMTSLDRLATVYRQSQQFETAQRELPRAMASLRRASDLALTFAKGGENGLIEAMEKFCVDKSKGPATRLGRLRKRLSSHRGADDVSSET